MFFEWHTKEIHLILMTCFPLKKFYVKNGDADMVVHWSDERNNIFHSSFLTAVTPHFVDDTLP